MNVATHTTPTFTLAAIGDAIVTRRLLPSKGVAPAFDGLLSLLRDVDATVTNFEVVAHEYEEYKMPLRDFEARNHDAEGTLMSDRANPEFWITVVPVCTFDAIELHPITLQQEPTQPQCVMPILASGEQNHDILARVAGRSEPFGTAIEVDDGVDIVRKTEATS